jgi:hypothetical protein
MSDGFVECPECAAKPGSPYLCTSCIQNRALISFLKRENVRLIDESMRMGTTIRRYENMVDAIKKDIEFKL